MKLNVSGQGRPRETTDQRRFRDGLPARPKTADALTSTAEKTSQNRERSDRRRAVLTTVRETRDRLTSATGTRPAFDYELALTYARNRISAGYAMPLLIIVFAAASLQWIDWRLTIVWAALVLASHLIVIDVCRRFIDMPPAAINQRRWRRHFAFAELGGGFAWSLLFALLPLAPTGLAVVQVFEFALLLVVVSVITSVASTMRPAALAGTVPITAVLSLVYLAGVSLLSLALVGMTIAAQVFFLILASRLNAATLAMLEFRAEKDMLIAELATAKSISDESRRRAEEANLAKSRFLATMSHELRTPLNAILGFSEIIHKELLGPVGHPNYKDYVNDIHTSGQHLLTLINEILDLSRIEAGRYELNEEPVNLLSVVIECQRLLQLKATSKNITIVEDYTRDLPRLWGDERAIRQVALNLLSNAIKFTPNGGEIRLKVGWSEGGGQFLSVRDNGPGIPEAEIPIVLSSFGQGSLAIKSAERGAGLGLSIVQALMQTHGGRFDLKTKLREGTEVIATFPQSRVMEALAPIPDPAPPARSNWLRAG
jgi:two-component system cell cycle sensor histidine kinase PleC